MARAGLTTERVALAGADLADEVGLERITVSEIARRFDVKVASLYSHVRSSNDLRIQIALIALGDLADRSAAALAGRAGKDALTALGGVYRDYARQFPGRYDATQVPLDAATAAASAGPRHVEMLRAVLRGYSLSDDDHTHAIRLLGSVFHGFATLERAGSFSHSQPGSQDSWDRILESLDATLQGWAAR